MADEYAEAWGNQMSETYGHLAQSESVEVSENEWDLVANRTYAHLLDKAIVSDTIRSGNMRKKLAVVWIDYAKQWLAKREQPESTGIFVCVALVSFTLNKEIPPVKTVNSGYSAPLELNHQFYMDDLKLHARSV
ncbi:unnamed protein product [Enterobius vermicularis]|uniref:Cyclin N-terminal domain-containing protein n=1 Tax=Enterobius vermicularis TaxID=51028 RepID=A0A0N4VQR0_ENTVE|nr:unnamed protein product [Enterobius vermicularis]